MSSSIHGHDVLHFMLETNQQHTRESLKQAIDARDDEKKLAELRKEVIEKMSKKPLPAN